MPIYESMIVITSQDLLHYDDYPTHEDCAPDTDNYHYEEDCACPTDDFVAKQTPLQLKKSDCSPNDSLALEQIPPHSNQTTPFLLPALHIDELTKNFYLGFNSLGQAGVTIFNQPVLNLLGAFQQPCTLAEGVYLVGNSPDGLTVAQRLAGLGLLQPVDSQPQPKQTKSQTLTAWLHVTNDCNLRCPYCYVYKSPESMEVECGQEAVEAVFRSALAHGFQQVKLKYAGGEATLNFPLVLTLHKYAQHLANQHGLGLDGVILSNGVGLTHRMIEELQAHELRLMISLDGVAEYHDVQRHFVNGHGSFKSIERTLDRLAAHDFTPSISITVSNRNLQGLPEIVDYVLQRKLPFSLNFYRENDCSMSFTDLAYHEEKIIEVMKASFAVIEADLPPYSLLGALLDRTRLDTLHDRTCGVGHSYMVINQRGGVAKCHMELEQAITDVSAVDLLQVIREDQIGIQNLSVEEKEGCRDCTWRYWCAGGCPALTYRVTGRFDVKSPNCRIYKALFPEMLRLEGLRLLKYSSTLPI